MATGTFPKTGTGGDKDPIRPDFSSVESASTKVSDWKFISETSSNMTVEYSLRTLSDGDEDLMRRRVKGSALFDDAAWTALLATQKVDFLRTALQNVVKYLLRGAP